MSFDFVLQVKLTSPDYLFPHTLTKSQRSLFDGFYYHSSDSDSVHTIETQHSHKDYLQRDYKDSYNTDRILSSEESMCSSERAEQSKQQPGIFIFKENNPVQLTYYSQEITEAELSSCEDTLYDHGTDDEVSEAESTKCEDPLRDDTDDIDKMIEEELTSYEYPLCDNDDDINDTDNEDNNILNRICESNYIKYVGNERAHALQDCMNSNCFSDISFQVDNDESDQSCTSEIKIEKANITPEWFGSLQDLSDSGFVSHNVQEDRHQLVHSSHASSKCYKTGGNSDYVLPSHTLKSTDYLDSKVDGHHSCCHHYTDELETPANVRWTESESSLFPLDGRHDTNTDDTHSNSCSYSVAVWSRTNSSPLKLNISEDMEGAELMDSKYDPFDMMTTLDGLSLCSESSISNFKDINKKNESKEEISDYIGVDKTYH